jgi:hypothetical protein
MDHTQPGWPESVDISYLLPRTWPPVERPLDRALPVPDRRQLVDKETFDLDGPGEGGIDFQQLLMEMVIGSLFICSTFGQVSAAGVPPCRGRFSPPSG